MKRFSNIAVFLLLLVSCRQEMDSAVCSCKDDAVQVAISLSVAPALSGTPETRSVDDPESPGRPQIRTLCILQYAGTDADAQLVGDVVYLHDGSDGKKPLDLNRIPLTESNGQRHTLIILANTFSKIQPAATLGAMKDLYRNIYYADDVVGHDGAAALYPDGAEFFQRLHGIVVTEVTDGKSLSATLHRSHARIRVRLSNTGTDGLSIRTVRLRNVAEQDFYLTDYSYTDPDDGTVRQLYDTPFKSPFVFTNPMRIDFESEAWNGNADGTGNADYTWYVPANMRGADEGYDASYQKNRSERAIGATYLEVSGVYGTGQDIPIIYRFYLGANLVNDFNIMPNTAYTYDLAFDGKGRAESDSRVEDLSPVDFTCDANCYILNPPPTGSRTYTFNVVHRINTFWGERYGLNNAYPNYTIDATKQWKAFVMWVWLDNSTYLTADQHARILDKKEGNGSGNYMSDAQRIRITVPSNMKRGNYIVGVYIDDPSNILWSWHLWVTDYQPDDIGTMAPIPGKYVYEVGGGEVHRYAGASWKTGGRYENGYAMDRDLGAFDDKYHEGVREYNTALVYQYGRKDPFLAIGSRSTYNYYYNPDGTYRYLSYPAVSYSSAELSANGGMNVPYSVNHPIMFISGNSSWTDNDVFNPATYDATIVWQDPRCTGVTEYEEEGKSLFDPCPAGWRVPNFRGGTTQNWMAGFNGQSGSSQNTMGSSNDRRGRGYGTVYYPLGVSAGTATDVVPSAFFPSWYLRSTDNSTWNSSNRWTTSPYSKTDANTGYLYNGNSSSRNARAYGLSVRCVKE